ncbi:LCP family protein [Streptacidiphilus sp. P02-A3a]|uniref:LCP family protein n=1 Tax=Streptacidiphilus sp. P02-A3a TaxID=2704468 RepID=UPI0015FCED07|nr:LCP family protein [Streptacidiphilus sp. P02-A3a]QMU68165.1 LCP family protein [Streptacidiphilus sp. P02-A3a]
MTDNDGQQYPPAEPAPEYWQQYPPQEPGYETYPRTPYAQPDQPDYPQQPDYQQQPGYPQQPPAAPGGYGYQQQQYAEPGYGGYEYGDYPYQPQAEPPPVAPPPQARPGYADPYRTGGYDTGQYPAAPQAPGRYTADQYTVTQPAAAPPPRPVPPQRQRPAAAPGGAPGAPGAPVAPGDDGYREEEFAFVEDAEESADVIDWMKFSETRGERRDERRRRLRGRALVLGVVLLLVAVGGVGYLWADGKLFGSGHAVAAATGREEIAVHLHDSADHVYTALLVSDAGTHKGSTLLVPGTLVIPPDGGGAMVQLAGSVDTQGNSAIRTGLNTVLGSDISASWGLYTSFLQVLVDRLNGITLDSNTTISQGGKVVVSPGTATLNGAAAIAYATYQAKGEGAGAQLARYGQVLEALIKAMPQDPTSAAADITAMGEVADPSLPDATLGALLATLSTDANAGHFQTVTLPVQADGSPGAGAGTVVQQLLGGNVSSGSGTAVAARVSVVNATGVANDANLAAAAITNNGYTWVPGQATAPVQAASTITYTDPARANDAQQLAEDLNLPTSAVRKVTTPQSVDLLVTLGKDYHQD